MGADIYWVILSEDKISPPNLRNRFVNFNQYELGGCNSLNDREFNI